MAGIAGATARARHVSRCAAVGGVGDYIDLSAQAYIASGLEGAIPGYTYQGVIRRRYELNPWGTFDAQDGPDPHALHGGEPMGADRRVHGPPGVDRTGDVREPAHPATRTTMPSSTSTRSSYRAGTRSSCSMRGQARRICLAPVMNFEQVASDRHLRARDGFVTVDHPETGSVEYLAPAVLTTTGTR